jgi:hypothetical protein
MAMTAVQKRKYDKKKAEIQAILRAKGGSDSAFTEELPESVQQAMRKRRGEATDDRKTS